MENKRFLKPESPLCKNLSLYIHIPFCKTRCGYCDFLTFADKNSFFEPYKNALIQEIKSYDLSSYTINSVFIGGGTPTVLPCNFTEEILLAVYTHPIAENAEITIEANPGNLSLNYLRTLKNSGINRLSLGLQAWQNIVLKKLNRGHNLKDFLTNYKNARKLGYSNINIDLIFSLPFFENDIQAFNNWLTTLKNTVESEPDHISLYSLILEENTPFFIAYEQNKLKPQSPELDRRMYHFACNYLAKKGYSHYEISNFAKKNKESRHNSVYWQRGEYLGLGLGSHSFMNNARWFNEENLTEYIKNSGKSLKYAYTILSKKEAMEEFVFLGLRCIEGISPQTFKENFGVDLMRVFGKIIECNIKKGFLEIKNHRLKLTRNALDISNKVMSDFYNTE